jgi:hypothetical protein
MSPNEGGSGNSTPLFVDLCFILLGWSALRGIAKDAVPEDNSLPLQALSLLPAASGGGSLRQVPHGADAFDDILRWAKASMDLPREDLERYLFEFQRNFLGGKAREVEVLVTSGGSRSINFSFESVVTRARKNLGPASPIKVITGNPHLAVERAERRFQFQVIRVDEDGVLSVDALKREIVDPTVVAVYAQTLSFTDGITDPLPEILDVIEEENRRRETKNAVPVTLINDSCLAFSVLVHNDGRNNAKSMRVLDLGERCITPTIVMLDAHKHLGADKGVSMTMGTPGTLSNLNGHVRVGAAPTKGELIRAIADLSLVSVDGYYEKYRGLASAVEKLVQTMEASGMTIIHAKNRVKGSTVFAVEDPSAVLGKKLKKKGHSTMPIYQVCPQQPMRCQMGFQLSLTPHSLRNVNDGKPALEVFERDVVEVHKAATTSYPSLVARTFHESALPAVLLAGGNEELWLFGLLRRPGIGRAAVSLVTRRLYSGILDCGVACSDRRRSALKDLSYRAAALLMGLVLLMLRRRRARRLR